MVIMNFLIRNLLQLWGHESQRMMVFFLVKLIVSSLYSKDVSTVSGLATGIDQCCHYESLRYGIPTIAVLGNGIFVEYPKGSKELYRAIVSNGGAIVTEYLPEQTYSAENFCKA